MSDRHAHALQLFGSVDRVSSQGKSNHSTDIRHGHPIVGCAPGHTTPAVHVECERCGALNKECECEVAWGVCSSCGFDGYDDEPCDCGYGVEGC